MDTISSSFYDSPVGTYEVSADKDGILSIKLISKEKIEEHEKTMPSSARKHIQDCLKWMDVYFTDLSKIDKIKSPVLNTARFRHKKFCCHVWKMLLEELHPGQTMSYGEVAKLAGNPKAARAVGMAMKSNPFSIIMPCHRVLSRDGIGNYSSLNGVTTKRWLLEHENVNMEKLH
ncbi:methylated-DNA--protein-cysteine methyltransferase-like [Actinia tenebrosa]|uniref:Methylated-DNA--protein-cysteine methyltransferase n=1 Tax=Actinia tenebrosa TaxID=6105 RepID=A0A6P8HG48_ACTTE|nr:methylated-DNA--protein-cysteine methyltransferase-like [Actinia tenebrosa]